ncbi:hypothetical protein [Cloacibacillus evryensis]|uniref:hypothetical protein n=1 Tax=Cloacibacillus evryensis TaxID=508460 RepID=UPI00241C7A89|nr:hypothetical protein [Cloacibacillus evryensis]
MRIKKTATQLFALFFALLVFALPARADLLFTRQTTYSDPVSLGIISGSSAPFSPLQSNMGGNQGNGIRPFLDANGKLRVALTFYTGVGTSTADTVNVFDPGAKASWAVPSNWNTPLKQFTCSVKNIRAISTIGSYLYATGYDRAVISRVVMTNDSYVENKVWTHPGSAGKHGEGLFTYAGHLYAIFSNAAGDPQQPDVAYSPNQIWKFDKDLNVIASADMVGRNMDGQQPGIYARVGNKLYICSFGGYQMTTGGYNHNTTVEVCDLSTLVSTRLLRGEETHAKYPDWVYMFSGTAFIDGKVYLHGTTWTAPAGKKGSHEMVVYETTADKLASGDIGTRLGSFVGDYGVQMGLNYDPTTKYLWAHAGDSIARYDGGTSWTLFDSKALKGSLSASAPIAVSSTGGSGAVIPTAIPIESADVAVAGGTITAITTNADAPSALAQAVSDGDYASAVTGGDSFGGVQPLSSFTIDLDHSASGSAAFTIKNFDYTPQTNGTLWAMVRKKAGMGGTFDLFPATLANGTLTFTITNISDYFTENTVVIAETTPVEIPDEPEPWTGDGAGTGGCEAGAATAALLALIPLALCGRKKK